MKHSTNPLLVPKLISKRFTHKKKIAEIKYYIFTISKIVELSSKGKTIFPFISHALTYQFIWIKIWFSPNWTIKVNKYELILKLLLKNLIKNFLEYDKLKIDKNEWII